MAAVALLAGCGTAPSSEGACRIWPPNASYSRAELAQASADLGILPAASPVHRMTTELGVVRSVRRAICGD